jgi:hypothetical protein
MKFVRSLREVFGNAATTPKQIERKFVWALGCGLAATLVVFLYVMSRPLFCEPKSDEWAAHTYQYATPAEYGAERRGQIVTKKRPYPEGKDADAAEKYWNDVCEILCSEIKVTDLVIGFFAYVAGIVTWFSMRRTDSTAKRTERAYIFCAGVDGLPNEGIILSDPRYRPKSTDFDKPWIMVLQNYGRTPGVVTKITWSRIRKANFLAYENKMVSHILKDKKLNVVERDIQDLFGPDSGRLRYRYVLVRRVVGDVFFGRIDYEDVFGEPHHSTFALLFQKEHTDTLGDSYSRDKS